MATRVKKHGLTGKRNAAKPAGERATQKIEIRCTAAEKSRWQAKAKAEGYTKLSAYVRALLECN